MIKSYDMVPLKKLAKIDISSVDKKTKDNEIEVKLCNFTDVYNNWSITKNKARSFMKATATKKEIDKFILKKGMIAITKDSETRDDIGISTYIADDFENVILGYHNALIIPNKELIYPKYLNAYLNSNYARKYFSNQASGSGQRYTLAIDGISNIKIPLPEMSVQKKIGNLFSRIDRKIENNNRINEIMNNMIKTVYGYWFIQYEFKSDKNEPYKSANGKMEWNEILKKEIPSNWIVQNLKENNLTSIINPGIKSFKGSKYYIATADVEQMDIINKSVITFDNRETRANMQPESNSIWFAKMKNSIKHIYVLPNSKELIDNYIFSTGFLGLKCNENYISDYVSSFINYDYFELQKNLKSHGATQEAVNNDDLKLIPFLIPEVQVLKRFSSIVHPYYETIYMNWKENMVLSEMMNRLLPLLISGQVVMNK